MLMPAAADDLTVRAFVALFDGPGDTSAQRLEALLWSQLQRLHELDVGRGARWSSDVSRDPADPRFSLSLAGHPFFVIGLHAGASRTARRFESPALVFNSHRQFDRLKGAAHAKDAAHQRARHRAAGFETRTWTTRRGVPSARQYSGRAVAANDLPVPPEARR